MSLIITRRRAGLSCHSQKSLTAGLKLEQGCKILSCKNKVLSCWWRRGDALASCWEMGSGSSLLSSNSKYNWLNPLTSKIWLLILPSSGYKFPCKLFTRIWGYRDQGDIFCRKSLSIPMTYLLDDIWIL